MVINLFSNGYLYLSGNPAFDFAFTWYGFFHVAGYSIGKIIQALGFIK